MQHGRVIANIEDYAVVRELVADLVAVGVDATVKPEVREVVQTVACLLEKGQERGPAVRTQVAFFNSTNQPFRAASPMPSMVGSSRTWKIARGVPRGSFSEMRCQMILRFSPPPSNWSMTKGCAVARLIGGIDHPHPLRVPTRKISRSRRSHPLRLRIPHGSSGYERRGGLAGGASRRHSSQDRWCRSAA